VAPSPSITARRETRLQDLSGLAAQTAIGRLRELELRPAIEPHDTSDCEAHGRVIAHDPMAGEPVRRGQLITLLIGHAPHLTSPDRLAPAPGSKSGPPPAMRPVAEALAPPAAGPARGDLPADELTTAPAATSADCDQAPDEDCSTEAPDAARDDPPVDDVPAARPERRYWRVAVRAGTAVVVAAAATTILVSGHAASTRPQRPAVAADRAIPSTPPPTPSVSAPARGVSPRRRRPPVARREPVSRTRSRHPSAARASALAPSAAPVTGPSRRAETTVDPPAPAPVVRVAPPSPTGPLPGPYPIQSTLGGSK
jgi:hypothetical protein